MTKEKSTAEIQVFFDDEVPVNTQVSFIKYIHEHLKKSAQDITRVRFYVCPHCGAPVKDLDVVRDRLAAGRTFIFCQSCDDKIPLIDLMEEKFASPEILSAVQKMDADAQINIDNESLELILAGHAFSIASEAGQMFHSTSSSDFGIDGAIEFKTTKGEASGSHVYLQLKPSDFYIRQPTRDDKEILVIKRRDLAEYWMNQTHPVMLVIRGSDGNIRWMDITEYLKRHGVDTEQVVFKGETFTAANVAKMRKKLVGTDENGEASTAPIPASPMPKAIQTTPPIRLLHLSDLHFTADTSPKTHLVPLLEDLRRGECLGFENVDYLVVSGDMTDRGRRCGIRARR